MSWSHRLKPASSRRTRLFLAGAIWSAVGAGLLLAGARWILSANARVAWPALAVAVALGYAKGRLLLVRRAEDNARRIIESDDRRCVGGVFSWKAWLFVAAMAAAGFVLRHSPAPRFWIGLVYAAVGAALLLASRVPWGHWVGLRHEAEDHA